MRVPPHTWYYGGPRTAGRAGVIRTLDRSRIRRELFTAELLPYKDATYINV